MGLHFLGPDLAVATGSQACPSPAVCSGGGEEAMPLGQWWSRREL